MEVAPPHKLPSLNCLNTTYTLVYVLIYIIIVIRIWKLHAFRTVYYCLLLSCPGQLRNRSIKNMKQNFRYVRYLAVPFRRRPRWGGLDIKAERCSGSPVGGPWLCEVDLFNR